MFIAELLTTLTDFLNANPYASSLIAFLVAFFESLAIVGTIVPGSVTMTAIGSLAGSGIIPMNTTVGAALIGAICGDYLSYWAGLNYHIQIKNHRWFKPHAALFERGEAYFQKHGGKSILIGRFFGPLRSMIPLVAGVLQFPRRRFLIAAIPSSAVWALIYMFPGIILGKTTERSTLLNLGDCLLELLLMLASAALLAWVLKAVAQHLQQHMGAYFKQGHNTLMKRYPACKPLYFDAYQSLLGSAAILSLLLFSWLAVHMINLGHSTSLDQHIFQGLQTLHNDFSASSLAALTLLGDKRVILSTTILLCLWCARLKRWPMGFTLLANISISCLAVYTLKHTYPLARPLSLQLGQLSGSFPSGHTTLGTALITQMAGLAALSMPKGKRTRFYYPAVLTIFSVLFSRLYLNAHWLSDVLGGLLLGLGLTLPWLLVYRYLTQNQQRPHLQQVLLPFLSIYAFSWLSFALYGWFL